MLRLDPWTGLWELLDTTQLELDLMCHSPDSAQIDKDDCKFTGLSIVSDSFYICCTVLSPLFCTFAAHNITDAYNSCMLDFILIWDAVPSRYNKEKEDKEARSFDFFYRYIDNVLPINNPYLWDWFPLIYLPDQRGISARIYNKSEI